MKKEDLEKWNNTCIKVLSEEHGKQVIKFWKSVGVETKMRGNVIGDYYGLFDGEFNEFTNKKYWCKAKILTLEEAIAIRDNKNINLEKWENKFIKPLSKEHGGEIIKFWKSLGFNDAGYTGSNFNNYYGIREGLVDCISSSQSFDILTLEEAIAIRDKNNKTFPREMYVWDGDIENAKKKNVVYIAKDVDFEHVVMTYTNFGWYPFKNAMEIEEYELIMKEKNYNSELIKQIEKTQKELAELKSKLK